MGVKESPSSREAPGSGGCLPAVSSELGNTLPWIEKPLQVIKIMLRQEDGQLRAITRLKAVWDTGTVVLEQRPRKTL